MPAPKPINPDPDWPHYSLYTRVKDALYSIPNHFNSRTWIEGLNATDVQTLNSVLGATIEDQVVTTLNRMRPTWDPQDTYQQFSFQRQAQVFPDVLLKANHNGQDIVLGIELKGWYLLAKEKEPNFRFTTTPNACASADLITVVPWILSNILSGSPITLKPFVIQTKYVAEYRNYWWKEIRKTSQNPEIVSPPNVSPYPAKSHKIADRPMNDNGTNFGRIARTGLLDDYIKETLNTTLSGIPATEWINFMRKFSQ